MKSKIKTLMKILAVLLVIFIIFSNTNFAFADETQQQEEENPLDAIMKGIEAVLDGIVGILTWPLRLIPLMIGGALQMLGASVGDIGGGKTIFLTMEDILFNDLPILRVNFFATDTGTVGAIQQNVAKWYYGLRNLAIILSLVVLIYIGIRMAISTLADDKAKYKKMLTDWVVGFITIFFLHYLIVIILYANDNLVMIFKNSMPDIGVQSFVGEMAGMSLDISAIKGWTGSILYICTVALTFMFLFNYIKRMLTVAFLVVISPIITVTYSIDRAGDGKSQALNTWMKEFVYNVIIQPFHCIIYLVFMSMIQGLMTSNDGKFASIGIGTGVVAIVIMFFIKQAEPIVRKIFGFDNASSLGSAVASGALLLGSMKTAANVAGKAAGAAGGKGKSSGGSGSGSSPKKSGPKASSNASRNAENIKKETSQNGTQNKPGQNSNNQTGANNGNGAGQNAGPDGGSNAGQQNGTGANGGTSNSTNASGTNKGDNSGANAGQRELDTSPTETQREKWARRGKDFLVGGARITSAATAGALGAFLSDDPVTGAMIGYNYGKAITAGGENLGKRAITGIKGAAKKAGRAATYSKLTGSFTSNGIKRERNDIIDSIEELQKNHPVYKNYDDIETLATSLLQVNDLDRINDPNLKQFGERLHKYRQEFEGTYKAPNDMVIDTLRKINSGEIKHQDVRPARFTRKKQGNGKK